MKRMRRIMKTIVSVFIVLLLGLGVLIEKAGTWALGLFGGISIDEIIFHLKVPLSGTDSSTIVQFIKVCLFPALAVMLLVVGIMILPGMERSFRKKREKKTGRKLFLQVQWKKKTKVSGEPFLTWHVPFGVIVAVAVITFGWGTYRICQKYPVIEYFTTQGNTSPWIEEEYVIPDASLLTWPKEKRNLIYIYLESMETSFSSVENGGAFEKDMIPELMELAKENVSFSDDETLAGGATEATSTGWTIAGMFGQTAGLPLKLPIDSNNMGEYAEFFPGVTSLGDLMEEAGYHNYLLIGSDAVFGGRNNYFSQHGSYELLDYGWAMREGKIPEEYKVFWGYEDKRLFDIAKEMILNAAAQEEPFNVTMLTVDTHFPDGYTCELCTDEFDTPYKNALACSSRQVMEFVRWIQEQDFYKNTTVILSGDHITMATGIISEMPADYQRRIYNCFINADAETEMTKNRQFTVMDLFPTTLAALGVEIEGERLALGTNLFSGEQTLAEKFGIDYINEQMAMKSEFYDDKLLYNNWD
ncbi:MAG: LTA synthase family protein [Lachnospiraceae bacterium]|nr:LTA synthase family protein [Lachnospiraceae bacterium]